METTLTIYPGQQLTITVPAVFTGYATVGGVYHTLNAGNTYTFGSYAENVAVAIRSTVGEASTSIANVDFDTPAEVVAVAAAAVAPIYAALDIINGPVSPLPGVLENKAHVAKIDDNTISVAAGSALVRKSDNTLHTVSWDADPSVDIAALNGGALTDGQLRWIVYQWDETETDIELALLELLPASMSAMDRVALIGRLWDTDGTVTVSGLHIKLASDPYAAIAGVSWATPALNVRNSVTAAPAAQIPWEVSDLPGDKARYTADDQSTLTINGSGVSAWADQFGGWPAAAQSEASKQPQTGVATINGKNTVLFDGVNDFLQTATNPYGSTIQDGFVWAVIDTKTATQSTLFSLTGSYNSTNRWNAHTPWSTQQIIFDSGGTSGDNRLAGSSLGPNTNAILGLYCSTTDGVQEVWLNGVKVLSDETGHAVATVNGLIFGSVDGVQSYDNVAIGEIGFINGTITDDDKARLFGRLAHDWLLTDSLPAGHPYKTEVPYTDETDGLLDISSGELARWPVVSDHVTGSHLFDYSGHAPVTSMWGHLKSNDDYDTITDCTAANLTTYYDSGASTPTEVTAGKYVVHRLGVYAGSGERVWFRGQAMYDSMILATAGMLTEPFEMADWAADAAQISPVAYIIARKGEAVFETNGTYCKIIPWVG